MSKPEMVANAGIYSFRWSEHNLAIRVDRIRERSDQVSCEITIKSGLPGESSHLHQARFNLSSTTSRKSLAKYMDDRYGNPPPWVDVLEQLCVMTLVHYREGEPVVRLGDVPQRENLMWRVYPFLAENQANVLYGEGQTGKSMIAAYLSTLVDSPLDHNGFIVEPGNVMILDYETDESEAAERVRALQAGLEIGTSTDIIYRFGRLPLADDIEQIQRVVLEYEINLVVVDSFGMAAGGDQDKSTDIIRYFQALRSLRCTSLTIDHMNKAGGQYGNVYKFNEARCIWMTKSVTEAGSGGLDIGLYHKKMNNGRLLNPIALHMDFTDGVCTVTKQDISTIPDLDRSVPLRLRLQEALGRGAMNVKDLSEELETSVANIRTTLNRDKAHFVPVYIDGAREPAWGLKELSHA